MLTLEAIASLAIAQGQMESATRLLGATGTWHARFYYSRTPRERQEREACISELRTTMGEQAFNTAFAEGQAMTPEQATEYANGLFPSKQDLASFAYLSSEWTGDPQPE